MTTLEAKFEALETALATQHTEIMNALDTIAMALGAPPPGPTTTLADIATMLSSLNDSLSGILSANATYYASNLEVLGLINTNVDTMLNNNSLNTQKLISAIYATYCACSTTAPLLPTPLDTTPTSLADQDKCKRIQFYISLFGRWLDKIANYGNSASFITGDVIGTLLGLAAADAGLVATGAEVGAAAGPPGVVIGAVVGLIIGAIYTLGGSVLIDYASQFNAPTLKAALLAAMFAATNADEGNSAFHSVIDANFSAIPAGIINALWWASWSNDVYATTPTVDDSAFDGTICVPTSDCQTLTSTQTTFGSDGTGEAIIWPSPIDASDHTPANYYTQFNMWATTNLIGWSFTPAASVLLVENWAFSGITVPAGVTHTFGNTDHAIIYNFPSTTPFSIELCQPS